MYGKTPTITLNENKIQTQEIEFLSRQPFLRKLIMQQIGLLAIKMDFVQLV
jgi:hypothetical protein